MAPEMESDGNCGCGKPGTLAIDPVREALYGESVLMILCPDCYAEAVNAT